MDVVSGTNSNNQPDIGAHLVKVGVVVYSGGHGKYIMAIPNQL